MSDENLSSNKMLDSESLTDEELAILRGDLVGDGAHSARWIIGVLKSIAKAPEEGFSNELQEKYRVLYEISIEIDVRNFLIQHDFIDLAASLLNYLDEPSELVEITIGILANLCYDDEAISKVAERTHTVERIFGFLECYESAVLISVVRFMQLLVFKISKTTGTLWEGYIKSCEFLRERLIFILKNSSSHDLLVETVFLLHYMALTEIESNNILIEIFKHFPNSLIPGLLECFIEVMKMSDGSCSSADKKFISKWLETFDVAKTIPSVDLMFEEESMKWIGFMNRILKPYKKCDNFSEEDVDFIEQTIIIVETWCSKTKVPKEVNQYLGYVTININKVIDKSMEADLAEVTKLRKITNKYWLNLVKTYDRNEILEIIQPFKPWDCKYLIEFNDSEEISHSLLLKIKDIVASCGLP